MVPPKTVELPAGSVRVAGVALAFWMIGLMALLELIPLMLTLLPCRGVDWPPNYENQRDALNQLILAAPEQYADYVVDVSDLSDPDVFSPVDHVHLTDSGSVKVAKRVVSRLGPLLSKQK